MPTEPLFGSAAVRLFCEPRRIHRLRQTSRRQFFISSANSPSTNNFSRGGEVHIARMALQIPIGSATDPVATVSWSSDPHVAAVVQCGRRVDGVSTVATVVGCRHGSVASL